MLKTTRAISFVARSAGRATVGRTLYRRVGNEGQVSQETSGTGSNSLRMAAPLKVLVVEDFEDTRFLMRLELEKRGFRVVEAMDGEQGVELAARERPDIIIMDIGLPLIDGIEATRRIRGDNTMRDVLIVALTAHHETEYRARALAAGCDAYLTKPVDFDWLIDLLGRLLP
ncbi:MAG TPA: response regulator [Pyrinomonadaceae bacterium]|nr:response regulator [Pyrinomonadaceae bacterium]